MEELCLSVSELRRYGEYSSSVRVVLARVALGIYELECAMMSSIYVCALFNFLGITRSFSELGYDGVCLLGMNLAWMCWFVLCCVVLY